MADIIKYLPDVYKEFYEYQRTADSINPEFDLFRENVQKVVENFFPNTADRSAIERFEELLDIVPLPTQTLQDRRQQVITKLNYKLPYTEIQLRKMLAAVLGWENYKLIIEHLKAKLYIYEDNPTAIESSRKLFWDIIPMNMEAEFGQYLGNLNASIYVGAVANTGAELNILPKQDDPYNPSLRLGSRVNFYSGLTLRITPKG